MGRMAVLMTSVFLALLLASCGDEAQSSENTLSEVETSPAVHEGLRVMIEYPSSWNRNDSRNNVRLYPERQEESIDVVLGGYYGGCELENGIEQGIDCVVESMKQPYNSQKVFTDISTKTKDTDHFTLHTVESFNEVQQHKQIVAYTLVEFESGNKAVVVLSLVGPLELVEKHEDTFEAIMETLRPS